MKKLFRILVLMALSFLLQSCNGSSNNSAPVITNNFIETFEAFDSVNKWYVADNYSNGGVFNCDFKADHVGVSLGIIQLQLNNTAGPTKSYTCSEIRTRDATGLFKYGRYEVRMKIPPQNNGIVSSFFNYTSTPHDEIDLEFLGKNVFQMQTNFFVSGVGGNEQIVNLGFDASAAFHTYAFEWRENFIKWYVDGVLVRTVYGTALTLPSHATKIYANIWNGIGTDAWLNPFVYTAPLNAQYDSIIFTE